MLKISSDIYLIKFQLRRAKCRTLMFATSFPKRNGFRYVLSQQEVDFFFFKLSLLPSIREVTGSLVTFGCCALKGTGLEFVGVILEGSFQEAEIKLFAIIGIYYDVESCPLPTPGSCLGPLAKTRLWLFHFLLLHPPLWTSNIDIPFVYSIMEIVYLFYFSIFWTKIFVSFCWNVHTVNVCWN